MCVINDFSISSSFITIKAEFNVILVHFALASRRKMKLHAFFMLPERIRKNVIE